MVPGSKKIGLKMTKQSHKQWVEKLRKRMGCPALGTRRYDDVRDMIEIMEKAEGDIIAQAKITGAEEVVELILNCGTPLAAIEGDSPGKFRRVVLKNNVIKSLAKYKGGKR